MTITNRKWSLKAQGCRRQFNLLSFILLSRCLLMRSDFGIIRCSALQSSCGAYSNKNCHSVTDMQISGRAPGIQQLMHQSIPAAPIPPPDNCRAFACLASPVGRALANLARPGDRAFAYPWAFDTQVVSDSKSKHGGFYRKGPAVRR